MSSGTSSGGSKPSNLTETIRQIEIQIARHGPGPHSGTQKEELTKLNLLLNRAKEQRYQMSKNEAANQLSNTSGTASPSTMGGRVGASPSPSVASGLMLAENKVLDKRRLQELVKEVDPLEQLDEEVEEVLMQIADDFIDNVVTAACQLAKHRNATTLDVKDVQLHLERNWNMWVPGFGSDELRPYKKAATTEAHKQRMALIRKTLKKY